jgi:hypothetical protein
MIKTYLTIPKRKPLFILLMIAVTFWFILLTKTMAAPPRQGQEIAVITNPANNAIVRGVVQITGSADSPTFQFYVIDLAPEPLTGDQWSTIGATHDAPVINGLLETWDTTQIPDGSYTLRLRVVRIDGNYTEFFAQQVVVTNTQPVPTDTPPPIEATALLLPTATPTDLPPTPTIVIEQPIVDTPTPRPVATSLPLEDPDDNSSFIPTVTGFAISPLRNACLYGGGIMLSVFLFFGFLSALRIFIRGFIDRLRDR